MIFIFFVKEFFYFKNSRLVVCILMLTRETPITSASNVAAELDQHWGKIRGNCPRGFGRSKALNILGQPTDTDQWCGWGSCTSSDRRSPYDWSRCWWSLRNLVLSIVTEPDVCDHLMKASKCSLRWCERQCILPHRINEVQYTAHMSAICALSACTLTSTIASSSCYA